MATWRRTSADPVTTERRVTVTDGVRTGYVNLYWDSNRPVFGSTVYDELPAVTDEHGNAIEPPESRILDSDPRFA